MSEVLVEVNQAQGSAKLSGTGLTPDQWQYVRDACEFGGSDVTFVGDFQVNMPVWALLRARSDLRFAFKKVSGLGVSVRFTQDAERVLRTASEREKRLANPGSLKSAKDIEHELQKLGFGRTLKSYQAENVAKLLLYSAGATFSVPGAGKTTEALALYSVRRSPDSRLLVICPKNAFAVWEEQVSLCFPPLANRIARLRGTAQEIEAKLDSPAEIFLINYDLVPRNLRQLVKLCLQHPTSVFVDESHRFKAWPAKVTGSALLTLSPFATERLVMSGTPMPNSTTDLLSQFAFLYPEAKVGLDDVLNRFSNVFVRTTKQQLDLPMLERVAVPVPMSDAQRELYQVLTSDLAKKIAGLRAQDRHAFRRIGKSVIRLIQAASDPALLVNSDMRDHALLRRAVQEQSPKVTTACLRARQLAKKGEKCIIWTNFVQEVLQVASLLVDLGAEFIYGDVKTSEDDQVLDSREAKIRRFKENNSTYVLVANPAACSESISLHQVCHHAIYIDRTYNAAQYLQSEDRIHRLGLDKKQETIAYLLQSPGTIDDSVDRRLQAKVARMSQFLNDPGLSIPAVDLTNEDPVGLDDDDLQDLRSLIGIGG